MATTLSLITVTWNHREEIAEFMDAVDAARRESRLAIELIVVDNASQDETASFVREGWPWARVIANPTNVGFAEGCSIGLRAASGDFLMLINPDAFAEAAALDGMVDFLRATPSTGAIGCTLLHDDGQPQDSHYPPITARTYWLYSSILYPLFESMRKNRLRGRPVKGARPCGWLMGSCIMVPRGVYERVGGLEASYFMYCEDADWCARIRDAGYGVWFIPELVMRHRQKGSSRRAAEFTFRRVYRSMVHYANRNLRGAERTWLLWSMALDMILRIPVYTALGFLRPARFRRVVSVLRLLCVVIVANPDLFHDPRPERNAG